MEKLNRRFFQRDARDVACDLLGKKIKRKTKKGEIEARIIETEAYLGEDDKASHARFGMTSRNKIMYEEAGSIYVYLIYGMYYNFNIITGEKNDPQGVLIRAADVLRNKNIVIENLRKFKKVDAQKNLLIGPGKFCAGLNITKQFNGKDLTSDKYIYLENDSKEFETTCGPRIGVEYSEEYKNKPWRFYIKK